MRKIIHATILAAGVGALAIASAAPQAEARPRRGAVAAGVAAGVVGGAIVGSLAARQQGYYAEQGYYREPAYGYREPAYGPGYTVYQREPDYQTYGYAPSYRQFGYVVPGTTGLRSGVTRVSPHYDH